jgi:hypothetical protein
MHKRGNDANTNHSHYLKYSMEINADCPQEFKGECKNTYLKYM